MKPFGDLAIQSLSEWGKLAFHCGSRFNGLFTLPVNSMKTRLLAILLIAAAAIPAVAETNTFVAPVTQTKQRHRPPPPISKRDVDGVIPRAFRGGNPLQMLNPRAPRKYGTSQEAVSFDVTDLYHPEKWRGIKFFEFRF
jgi:hypothetical protein